MSCAETSIAVTLNLPGALVHRRVPLFQLLPHSFGERVDRAGALGTCSAIVVSPMDNNIEAWTYLLRIRRIRRDLQLLTLKLILQCIQHLHAGQAEGNFAGRETAAFDHRLVGVHQSLRLRGIERNAHAILRSSTMLALPDWPLTPMTGLAPTWRDRTRDRRRDFCARCCRAFRPKCRKRRGRRWAAPCGASNRESAISRMCQAGKSGERFGRDEFGLAAQLHAADDGCEIHVAAALAGSNKRALNLNCAGENCCASIGDSQAAIGVAVKSEVGIGIPR